MSLLLLLHHHEAALLKTTEKSSTRYPSKDVPAADFLWLGLRPTLIKVNSQLAWFLRAWREIVLGALLRFEGLDVEDGRKGELFVAYRHCFAVSARRVLCAPR